MGCGGSKVITVDAAIDEVKSNGGNGFPNLLSAMEQSGKESSQQEGAKLNVPNVFSVLPKAMSGLDADMKNKKSVLAACSTIECCVKLCNDPSIGGTQVTIDMQDLTECVSRLVGWLKLLQSKAAKEFQESNLECPTSSIEAKAIALATAALFSLDKHAEACKKEFIKSGGVITTINAMKVEECGLSTAAATSLASMLSLLADTPENVANIIANGGNFVLIPYVAEPKTYSISKEMHAACTTILRACVDEPNVKNKDNIQEALANGSSASKRLSSFGG
jgi:hypothetical protein